MFQVLSLQYVYVTVLQAEAIVFLKSLNKYDFDLVLTYQFFL